MVTGGGGSIGSGLCRQIASYQPKQLIVFDIYENNAYDIQQELKRNIRIWIWWSWLAPFGIPEGSMRYLRRIGQRWCTMQLLINMYR